MSKSTNPRRRMMRLIASFLFVAVCTSLLPAQQYAFDWGWSVNDPASCDVEDVAFGSNGSIYAIGYFSDSIDVDPGSGTQFLSSTSSQDAYIIQLNASHNLVWARQIEGSHQDRLDNLSVDAQGNLYIDAEVAGTVDIDPGPGSLMLDRQLGDAAYLVKLDANGDFLWAAVLNCDLQSGNIYDHSMDANGDVVILGHWRGTADFDPGPGTHYLTNSDVEFHPFIWKLNAQGQLLWVKEFDQPFSGHAGSISFSSQSELLVTGAIHDSLDVDPGPGVHMLNAGSGNDIFLLHLDASGNFDWVKSLGNADPVHDAGVKLGTNDAIFWLVRFNTPPLDMDPDAGVVNAVQSDGIALLKLDSSGNFMWGVDAAWDGTSQTDNTWMVYNDEVYIAGMFNDLIDFDPGAATLTLTPTGFFDGYVVKVDAAGTLQFASQFQGYGNSSQFDFNALYVNGAGKVVIAGGTRDSVDLDPTNGIMVGYSVGLAACIIQLEDLGFVSGVAGEGKGLEGPRLFPNPNTGQFTLDFGQEMKSVDVCIYDGSGRLLWTYVAARGSQVPVDLSLATGLYLVTAKTKHGLNSWKMVVR